ncbi:MAG: SRPBCC domain-containing protein [Aquihabitans sp.]
MAASPERVFAVLADPTSYPQWLIGASEIRDHDADWPAVGSKFHHLVGVKPFVLADSTEVIAVDRDRSLKLHVRARPFVSAIATFTITGGPGGSVVCIEEEPAERTVGNLVRPVLDPMIHVRNHRSLRRLAVLLDRDVRPASDRA